MKARFAPIFVRFTGWWAACSGLVMMGGGCPCCAGGMCARGVAIFGAFGALFATFLKAKNQKTARKNEELAFASHDFSLEFPSHDRSNAPARH